MVGRKRSGMTARCQERQNTRGTDQSVRTIVTGRNKANPDPGTHQVGEVLVTAMESFKSGLEVDEQPEVQVDVEVG
ncbi:hypothetical protein LIA77_11147 [Sarocladium implicatum]|nr:hypothetical protein LIA77_11147 [Sarocladium implicatum]